MSRPQGWRQTERPGRPTGRVRCLPSPRSRLVAIGSLLSLLYASSGRPPASAQDLEAARELHRSGRITEALEAYSEVVAASRDSDPSAAASALNNTCLIYHARGDLDRADGACTAALEFRRQDGDPRGTSRTLNNLALVLQSQGRYDEAENRFEEALAINIERGDLEGQAINLGNLAQLATTRGEYGAALSRLGAVERLVEIERPPSWTLRQLAYTRFNQGVVLEKLGLYEEALSAYLEVDIEALGPADRSTVILNRGVVYRNLGDPYLALDAFEEALDLAEEFEDARGEAFAILNAAIVLDRNLHTPEAARKGYEDALSRSRHLQDVELELKARMYLAELDEPAVRGSVAAFDLIGLESEAHGFTEGVWRARYGAARSAAREGDREEAKVRFHAAIEVLETVRTAIAGNTLSDLYQDEVRRVYVDAVENLVELGDHEAAYDLVQLGKRRYRRIAGDDPSVRQAEIRRHLGRAVLIEYFIGRHSLYRWTLHRDSVAFHRIPGFDEIARQIESLHRDLSRGEAPSPSILEELSRSLLGDLRDETLGDRTYLAPDGRLGYLPFELLTTDDGHPLIELTIVAYVTSGGALVRGDDDRRPGSLRFSGLADPSLEGSRRAISTRDRIRRLGLGPLPGAARELERALATMPQPSVGYTGDEATKQALHGIAERGTAILHLGAHTLIEEGAGAEGAILLAPSESDDGLLLPSEIARLDLPTGLTVLAGCRTAIGFNDRSTALSDLAGAFLAAGSGAVVATLWEVGDQPTEQFMALFYDAVRAGEPPADALHQAKRRLLDDPEWSSPHLWSAYVLIGRGDQPVFARGGTRTAFGLALLSAVLIAFFFWISRSRTR